MEGGEPFTGVIVGARADEEGSRSKERYFSPRDQHNEWDVGDQPPELWNQFKTDFAPGTHVRIHPLLDWTELNIWEYIERENIPIIDLYFDQGKGTRYRSLGWIVAYEVQLEFHLSQDDGGQTQAFSLLDLCVHPQKDVGQRAGGNLRQG